MTSPHRPERQFGSVISTLFLAAALWPLLNDKTIAWLWLVVALVVFIISWFMPVVIRPALRSWLTLVHWLGIINTQLLLAITFFLVISPLALLFRLTGRDALKIKPRQAKSYWIKADKADKDWPAESFKNQF